jgi:hypothetical protein
MLKSFTGPLICGNIIFRRNMFHKCSLQLSDVNRSSLFNHMKHEPLLSWIFHRTLMSVYGLILTELAAPHRSKALG